MRELDIKKKIGQLMVIGFDGTVVPASIKQLIHEYHIGAFILFGRNIGTPKEILTLTRDLQIEAKKAGYERPLLICTDQENGVVRRLGEGATMFPGAMTLGATENSSYAYEVGYATALELKALGINWNLAPVLDVNNNPDNPVIGVRSFGETASFVSEFGAASMEGMQKGQIATTLKHFPGHGDTNVDSHLDLPVIAHNIERLEALELKPFKDAIGKGADTVMTAHVYFPAIEDRDGVPATLSHKVVTGLLREQLQFDGVVTTDCLEMNAISQTIGVERGAVEAIKAGVDYIMVSHRYEWQVNTMKEILQAVENGEINEARIDQSLARINQLKDKYVSWEDIPLHGEVIVPPIVGSKEHEELAYKVYKGAVTIMKDDALPVPIREEHRILVMYPEKNKIMMVEDKRYAGFDLGSVIKQYQPLTDVVPFSLDLDEQSVNELVEKASSYDTIIFGTLSATRNSVQVTLVEKLQEKNCSIVVIAMRSPYDFSYLPDVPAYINTYEFSLPALNVAAAAIFGKEKVTGKLPVTINKN